MTIDIRKKKAWPSPVTNLLISLLSTSMHLFIIVRPAFHQNTGGSNKWFELLLKEWNSIELLYQPTNQTVQGMSKLPIISFETCNPVPLWTWNHDNMSVIMTTICKWNLILTRPGFHNIQIWNGHKQPLNGPSVQGTKLNPDKHQQNH